MYWENYIGKLIFNHARMVLMYLAAKLRVPDGKHQSDKSMIVFQRSFTVSCQSSTVDLHHSHLMERKISQCINAQCTWPLQEVLPSCSLPSLRQSNHQLSGSWQVLHWFSMLKVFPMPTDQINRSDLHEEVKLI